MTDPAGSKISIVITAFNRPAQLAITLRSIREQHMGAGVEIVLVDDGVDDEITRWIAQTFEVDKYVKLKRPPSQGYRNQARPLNIGIRHAEGDVMILQNAECVHISKNCIDRLVAQVMHNNAVFARCIALDQDGREEEVYCGRENPRPYFFCGAIRRDWLMKLRGFDEDYKGYGYEDDDMADRLRREGVRFVFADDALVHHQWHEPAGIIDMSVNECMYKWKLSEPTVRNVGREWGQGA